MSAAAAPRTRAATIARALLAIVIAIVAVPFLIVGLLAAVNGKGN